MGGLDLGAKDPPVTLASSADPKNPPERRAAFPQGLDGPPILAQGAVGAAQADERSFEVPPGQSARDGALVEGHGLSLASQRIVDPGALVMHLRVVGSLGHELEK